MKSIQQLRESIDNIDDSILKLLVERMEFVEEIGRLKRENNTVIYHPDREKEIVDRLASKYTGKLSKAAIEAIFLEIFGVSRNLELPEISVRRNCANANAQLRVSILVLPNAL